VNAVAPLQTQIRPESVTAANRLAESFCGDVVNSQRGFEITATQRQLLFGLFRRAYLAGHGDGVQKRKD
jgi:hypothetical protein